ncbi:hypothetical protein [Embleya sp. NBC_00896]|uniref:hypothetical protein n=1 Tax=Embleya sp. NBC_00896 TaxID=2975961 RepID=UPI00386B5DA4|nr:hypothetical protein OG928_28150 [Embleya sp. NBC_00896]
MRTPIEPIDHRIVGRSLTGTTESPTPSQAVRRGLARSLDAVFTWAVVLLFLGLVAMALLFRPLSRAAHPDHDA